MLLCGSHSQSRSYAKNCMHVLCRIRPLTHPLNTTPRQPTTILPCHTHMCTHAHSSVRHSYFCVDPDSTPALPVFNLTAELKGGAAAPAAPRGPTKKGKGGRGESGK
jgi:hypothetical protein